MVRSDESGVRGSCVLCKICESNENSNLRDDSDGRAVCVSEKSESSLFHRLSECDNVVCVHQNVFYLIDFSGVVNVHIDIGSTEHQNVRNRR